MRVRALSMRSPRPSPTLWGPEVEEGSRRAGGKKRHRWGGGGFGVYGARKKNLGNLAQEFKYRPRKAGRKSTLLSEKTGKKERHEVFRGAGS